MPDSQARPDEHAADRHRMVERQIAARGIADPALLDAMRTVPRHLFVPEENRPLAHEDTALPIIEEQTISQPYIVARMIELAGLTPESTVLEIGAGSGYAAAVMSRMAARVLAIERIGPLADLAARTVASLGYDNIDIRHGDGTQGWPDAAPFDAILVAAGGRDVPRTLKEQLAIGGRLVIPVGPAGHQDLYRVVRHDADEYAQEKITAVRFVPLVSGPPSPET